MARYYGCGLIAPQALQGYKVLDLEGSSGRDAYVLACLVGESGSVTGVFRQHFRAH
jgi:arsenite methyltransferase